MYKEKVVDFLLERCQLKDRFTEDEVHHVIGMIDVNSVTIHRARSQNGNISRIIDKLIIP